VIEDVIAHAEQDAPDECCGLLVGHSLVIEEAVRTTNLERGPTRYRVDPAEHLALVKRLRGTGREVVGAYHSHPTTPAVPSASDVSEAFYPEFVYVIVSLEGTDPQVRAWRIVGARVVEQQILVETDTPR
jgi:proteasome lid subunit RPN8/RPN11